MRCVSDSTWRANMTEGVQIFQAILLRNAEGNFYTLLLYESILHYTWYHSYTYHMCICMVHKNCIILHSYISSHIKEKWGIFLFMFFSFLLFHQKWKYKKTWFLYVKSRVFSNFPQLKQLGKISNTCEYSDLLEFQSAWVGDPR